jgi:siroheme synthase (precorrin-2 oxidase/ferrochelatase)
MKLYPLVVKLEDKNCSLIGGGNQVHKKVLDLMEYSPKIFIFAETVSDSLQDLINNNKKIIWQKYSIQNIIKIPFGFYIG